MRCKYDLGIFSAFEVNGRIYKTNLGLYDYINGYSEVENIGADLLFWSIYIIFVANCAAESKKFVPELHLLIFAI